MTQLFECRDEEAVAVNVKAMNTKDNNTLPIVRLPVLEHRNPRSIVTKGTSQDWDSPSSSPSLSPSPSTSPSSSSSSSSSLSSTLPSVASSNPHYSSRSRLPEISVNLPPSSKEGYVKRQTEMIDPKSKRRSGAAHRKMQTGQARQNQTEASRQSQAASSEQLSQSNLILPPFPQIRPTASSRMSPTSSCDGNANARYRMIMNGIRQTVPPTQASRQTLHSSPTVTQSTRIQDSHSYCASARPPDISSRPSHGFTAPVTESRRFLPYPAGWPSWQQVSVNISQIPEALSVDDIRDGFGKEGKVVYVERFEKNSGRVEIR